MLDCGFIHYTDLTLGKQYLLDDYEPTFEGEKPPKIEKLPTDKARLELPSFLPCCTKRNKCF